jgi:site-specific recombinase XerD
MENERAPGFVPKVLNEVLSGDVSLLRADTRVFEAMLDGWRAQMMARGLTTPFIKNSSQVVTRFQDFTNDYPWSWQAHDVDEYMAVLRSRDKPVSLGTLRSYNSAIRQFCTYVTDARYGWARLCERTFGDVPSQVCFEWNTPRHTTEDAVTPARRPFTRAELQAFFDAADDLVDREYAAGSKRWLPALRDSVAFKVCYAYGLRRRELAMLETVDFGPNPHVPDYGNYGCVEVRGAKGTKGSGPRRRTVLTSPEFEWVTGLLEFWLSPAGRVRFPTADRSLSLWPGERSGCVTLRTLDRSFQVFLALAGLPPAGLSMHSLRHAHVTHQIEAGYDAAFIQAQVGHAHASTTALYTHVSADFKHKTVQRMIARRIGASGQPGDIRGTDG